MKIALIAHDKKKPDMIEFAKKHKEILVKYELIATGETGRLVSEATGLEVKQYLGGPYGGDQQIGSRIAENKVGLVIFSVIPNDFANPFTNTVFPLPNSPSKQIIIPGNFSDSIFSANSIVSNSLLDVYL